MRILEIGTGTGETALVLARTSTRMLLTMEADAERAAIARQRFAEAGLAGRISVIVGEPIRFLHKVRGPFDAIVVKDSAVPRQRLTPLLAPGGVIVAIDATIMVNDMTIAEWLADAKADAEKRGLPELLPMLEGLAQATARLRAADWNDDARTDPFDLTKDQRRDNDH